MRSHASAAAPSSRLSLDQKRKADAIEQEFRAQLLGSSRRRQVVEASSASAQLFGTCVPSSSSSNYDGVASASSIFRRQIRDPVTFYFGSEGLKVCRLCNEVCMVPQNHLDSMGHLVTELVVDLIEPNCSRGEDLKQLPRLWQRRMLASSESSRLEIEALMDMTIETRCVRLREYLGYLRDAGVAPVSLLQATEETQGSLRGQLCQRLECIGDHNWGNSIARRIRLAFPQIDWMSPIMSLSFDTLRSAAEANYMLEHVCDVIGLESLLPVSLGSNSIKFKADLVEALLGELYLAYWSCFPASVFDGRTRYADVGATDGGIRSPLSLVINHVIQEILDMIVLCTLSRNIVRIIPLMRDYVFTSKFCRLSEVATRKAYSPRGSARERVLLPGRSNLHVSPTAAYRSHHGTFPTKVAAQAMRLFGLEAEREASDYTGWEMAERGVVTLPFIAAKPEKAVDSRRGRSDVLLADYMLAAVPWSATFDTSVPRILDSTTD